MFEKHARLLQLLNRNLMEAAITKGLKGIVVPSDGRT
jgi:hypothetical protein